MTGASDEPRRVEQPRFVNMKARFVFVVTVLLALLVSINTFHVSFLVVVPNPGKGKVSATQRKISSKWQGSVVVGSSSLRPMCPREAVREGQWLPKILDAPPYIPRTVHLRCQVDGFDYDNPVGPWNTWEWTPSNTSCQFAAWIPETFCALLPFSTVSIIGDSLSWEHYSSLLQLLGARVHQTDQFRSRDEERNHVQIACTAKGQAAATKFVWRNAADLNASIVADSIEADFPTVLILNTGAHYRYDTDLLYGLRRTLPVLKQWQSDCTRRRLKCHLFWRTTVPGHPDCINFTEPVNDFQRMEVFVTSPSSYNNETWKYLWKWYDFQRQNQLVLKELDDYARRHRLQYQVLDAYEINLLRPDGHRWHQDDCLHNCYPGKIDVYSRLLLHFLQMERTIQDSEALVERFRRYRDQKLEAIAGTPNSSVGV